MLIISHTINSLPQPPFVIFYHPSSSLSLTWLPLKVFFTSFLYSPPSFLPTPHPVLFLYPHCHSFSWPSQILSSSFCSPHVLPRSLLLPSCPSYFLPPTLVYQVSLFRELFINVFMPPPSLSVAAICAQLGARLPVSFCPARGGQSHTWGHRSQTSIVTHAHSLLLCYSFVDTQTHTKTPSADSPLSLCCAAPGARWG